MVKFGVIGCGVIAPFHARAIEVCENAKLVAACDIVVEKANKFAANFNVEKIYEDYNDLIADPDIDVVCICTPSGMHGEMALAAAKAGKHILCEKPMEITKEMLNTLCEQLKQSNVKMGCVYQRRTQPIPMRVKNAMESGAFGKVLVADAYLKYYRSPEYYKSAGWRATWELDGGGALMNQGIHGIDLIAWFMGGIDSVNSIVRTQLHDIEVEDTALTLVKYRNGAVGVIEGTTCVQPAQDTRFEIHCENGSIIFSDAGLIQWNLNGKEYSEKDVSSSFSAKDNPQAIGKLSHLPIVEDMINVVKHGGEPIVPPEVAREAVDVILAIYESSKTNKEIKIQK